MSLLLLFGALADARGSVLAGHHVTAPSIVQTLAGPSAVGAGDQLGSATVIASSQGAGG